jgi:hypothetical protein
LKRDLSNENNGNPADKNISKELSLFSHRFPRKAEYLVVALPRNLVDILLANVVIQNLSRFHLLMGTWLSLSLDPRIFVLMWGLR